MNTISFLARLFRAAAFVASALAATIASAGVLTISGTTDGNPTWNRPVANDTSAPSVLSTIGTAVAYDVTHFQVTGTASYSFLSTAVGGWDNYLFLYEKSFDPLAQLTNVLIGNDNFPTAGISGFTLLTLTKGVDYYLVTTGYNNTSQGLYTAEITGSAENTAFPVPEPGSIALLGLALLGLARVRRRLRA